MKIIFPKNIRSAALLAQSADKNSISWSPELPCNYCTYLFSRYRKWILGI